MTLRKFLVFLMVLVAAFAFVGCDKEEEVDDATKIQQALGSIALGSTNNITQSFDLITKTGRHGLDITWTLENLQLETATLDTTGGTPKVVIVQDPYAEDDEGVPTNQWGQAKLTATVSIGNRSYSREWILSVPPAPKVFNMKAVEVIYGAQNMSIAVTGTVMYKFADGFMLKDDTGALYIYKPPKNDNVVAGAVVTVEGKISDYYGMKEIVDSKVTLVTPAPETGFDYSGAPQTLIPSISLMTTDRPDAFTKLVKVSGVATKGKDSGNYDVYMLTDPLTEERVFVYYKSEEEFLDQFEEVIGKYITFTGIVFDNYSKDDAWRLIGFPGTIVEGTQPTYTDTDRFNAIEAHLNCLYGGRKIATDLTLVNKSKFDSTVTWASQNTAILGNDGKIVAYPEEDTEVTLVATITLGSQTVTKEIKPIVQAVKKISIDQLNKAIDRGQASIAWVEGVIIGQTTDGYFFLADNSGVTFVRIKLSSIDCVVGDKIKLVGAGTVYSSKSYNRQVVSGSVTKLPADTEITPIVPVAAEIADFDNTITEANMNNLVKKETHYGKIITLEGYIKVDGSKVYLAASTEEDADKLIINSVSQNFNDLKTLDGLQVSLTVVVQEYTVADGWRLTFLGREGDFEITLTDAQKEAIAKAEIEKVVKEDDEVSGDLEFFEETAATLALGNTTYSFTTDKLNVIAADGTFTKPATDTAVVITVTVTFSATHTRAFTFNVTAKASGSAQGTVLYETGFESAEKPGYEAGEEDVTIDGLTWCLDNALIGNLDNDKYNGSWSVRARPVGSVYTTEGVANIKVIEAYIAKYGTDAGAQISVKVSKDGTNWVEVMAPVTPGSTLEKITIDLSTSTAFAEAGLLTSDSLRVKFEITGTSKKRVNIDDVKFIS